MAEPCGDCLHAGELGDRRPKPDAPWMCLIRSGYNEKGQFELIFIDRYTDWAKCPLYMSPTSEEIFEGDEFEEAAGDEDDGEDEEDDDE